MSCRQLKNRPDMYIEWFGVTESYRNKGIGTKMMNKMVKGLTQLGFKRLLSRASNWEEHIAGQWRYVYLGDTNTVKFYRKNGFRYRKGWMKKILKKGE